MGITVIRKVSVNDECNLNRGHFPFPYKFWFLRSALLSHLSVSLFLLSTAPLLEMQDSDGEKAGVGIRRGR